MKARTRMTVGAMAALMAMTAMAAQADARGPKDRDATAWNGARTASYQTLELGHDGPWSKACVEVASSEAAWDALMAEMAAEGGLAALPAPAAPQVDWRRYSVVLVSLGQVNQHGYSVQVAACQKRGRELRVEVSVQAPAGGLQCAVYAPYHLVLVEHANATRVQAEYTMAANGPMDAAGMAAPTSAAGSTSAADDGPEQTTWGSVKGQYR